MSFIGIIVKFLASIDYIIYNIASTLFTVIFDLADAEIITSGQIKNVTGRIYVVVGVLMLFKVVIAAIQYMINPDSFDDREKGAAGLLKRVAITMGLIVVVPAVFNFLLSIQTDVVTSLPLVVLGEPFNESDKDQVGNDLSFAVMKSFIKVREGTDTNGLKNNQNNEIGDSNSFNVFVDKIDENCPNIVIIGRQDNNECKYEIIFFIVTFN